MSRTRPYIPEGIDHQGRLSPSALVIDRLPEEFDAEESRDGLTAGEVWLLLAIYCASATFGIWLLIALVKAILP